MPNVEIHGYGHLEEKDGIMHLHEFAWVLRREILARTKGLPLTIDMVVTIFADECLNRVDDAQPFIRIISTTPSDFEELVALLYELKDIEIPQIFFFNEKGKKPDWSELKTKCARFASNDGIAEDSHR